MTAAETTITLVVVVGAVALVMKAFTRDEKAVAPSGDADDVDRLLAEVSGADPGTEGEVMAIDSEGWSFVPEGRSVVLVPPPLSEADRAVLASPGNEAGDRHGHSQPSHPRRINTGELVGVRVKRGAPDLDPWRLEAVGRDGDYRAWFFETEEAARAAMDLLDRRIVRAPKDEDGDPRPLGPEDFEEARRLDEETERALDDEGE